MSARQSFVPRSASRASTHPDTEHPFDMPLRNQNSLGQRKRTGSIQHEVDPTPHKTDTEKGARFAGILGKRTHTDKPGTGDHQAFRDTSVSSAYRRFSGILRPDAQPLASHRRSSSPFIRKGSPSVPSSNPGVSFARPTSPMQKSPSQRAYLTISGLKDAHISTDGVVSGLISTSPIIAEPVPIYGFINKSFVAKSQPLQLLERTYEDNEPETASDDEALLDARRTNVAAHPGLRRVEHTIQGAQLTKTTIKDEDDFPLQDEIEYMRRVKRARIDEVPHELQDGPFDDSSYSGIDYAQQQQPDIQVDNDTPRQSSPPRSSGSAQEISLGGMFANMGTFLNEETFMDLVQKWSTCSRDEWLRGSEEIAEQFKDIIDCVKENLTANVTLYCRLEDQVRDRREEQAQLTEDLRRRLGSARADLIAICPGK